MTIIASPIKNYTMRCDECGFSTRDQSLIESHSCDVQRSNGHCEDFPSCGHEFGDCNGLLYGSDAAIQADPHLLCDHNTGVCEVWDAQQYEREELEDDGEWQSQDEDDYDYDPHDQFPSNLDGNN